MTRAAFSPDGKMAAYIDSTNRVILFDLQSKTSFDHAFPNEKDASNYELAWSTEPDKFYVRLNKQVLLATISPDGNITIEKSQGSPFPILPVYGIYDEYVYKKRRHPYVAGMFYCEETDGLHVEAHAGMLGKFIARKGQDSVLLADNPGLWHESKSNFEFFCILDNAEEIVFDMSYRGGNKSSIYLLNIDSDKVGFLADGKKPFAISPRFSRETAWNEAIQSSSP